MGCAGTSVFFLRVLPANSRVMTFKRRAAAKKMTFKRYGRVKNTVRCREAAEIEKLIIEVRAEDARKKNRV